MRRLFPIAFVLWLAAALHAETASSPTQRDTLTIDYDDTDIRVILTNVAKVCGVRVVVPETLVGTTSIRLHDVTWRQIFDVVLSPIGWGFIERDDGTVEVLPIEQIDRLPEDRRSVEIFFQRPAELALFLSKMFGQKITVEETADGVTFRTHPRYTRVVLQTIARIDNPEVRLDPFPRQVYFPDTIPELTPPDSGARPLVNMPEFVTTEIIVLHWVDCGAVKRVIEREYPGINKVTADYRSNTLIISGQSEQNRRVSALAAYLDDKRWYHRPEKAPIPAPTAPAGAGTANNPHRLDGTVAVVEGRWNALAKEEGQVICLSEPEVIDVIDVGQRPVPKHEELIRVTAILHWRGMTKEEKELAKEHIAQGVPDGYIIRWPEADWKTLGPPDDGEYERLFENAARKHDSQREGVPSQAREKTATAAIPAEGQPSRQP